MKLRLIRQKKNLSRGDGEGELKKIKEHEEIFILLINQIF